jgi:hypothetical protein
VSMTTSGPVRETKDVLHSVTSPSRTPGLLLICSGALDIIIVGCRYISLSPTELTWALACC